MKKSIAIIASVAAAAAITTAAGAYDINTDLGFGWSTSVTISGDEFADVTTDTTVTITYKTDPTLADPRSGLLVHQAHDQRRRLAFHQHTERRTALRGRRQLRYRRRQLLHQLHYPR